MFTYEGPATIGGVAFTEVSLHEQRQRMVDLVEGYTRSWEGTATIPLSAWPPPLFGMPNTQTLELVLPDGRSGRICASARCDNGHWTLEIMGEGPAPGCE